MSAPATAASRPADPAHDAGPAAPRPPWWRRPVEALPPAAIVGWFTWAYVRLRPPPDLSGPHQPIGAYQQWAYAHFTYSDLPALYDSHHLADHALPYVHTLIEYPVLTGIYMWLAAWFPGMQGYFLASSLGLLACALGTYAMLRRLIGGRAWVFAASPLLLPYGLLNWDLLAIVLMAAGWVQYKNRRFGWAGVLLSMGVCAKFFPLLLLIYGYAALVRKGASAQDRVGARSMLVAAVVTGVVVNLPFAVSNVEVWGDFFSFNATRQDTSGLLEQFNTAAHWPVAAVDAVAGVVVAAAMVWLARRVLRGAAPEFAAAAAFAVFMLMNKVFSPQYMLWVLVFGLLAEWPGWAVSAITVAGLADYADAMVILHLADEGTARPDFLYWFHEVYPLDKAIRLGSIGAGLVGTVWRHVADGRAAAGGDDARRPMPVGAGRRPTP